MKQIRFFIFGLIFFGLSSFAANYKVDGAHSSVSFKIRHLLSKVTGNFGDFSGSIQFDPKKPTATKVKFTIQAASIDTNNKNRDDHLRNADFFDVNKYKTIDFQSTSAQAAGKNKVKLTGKLSMHGVTKPVTFQMVYNGKVKDPWGNMKAGFSATTTIDRQQFNLKYNKVLGAGDKMLGDEVAVDVEIEAVEQKGKKG